MGGMVETNSSNGENGMGERIDTANRARRYEERAMQNEGTDTGLGRRYWLMAAREWDEIGCDGDAGECRDRADDEL